MRAIPGDDLRSVRNRALIVIGMAGAFRRSELVALRPDQLIRTARGLRVRFGQTKADQKGHGEEIASPKGRRIRPVQLLNAWLAWGAITEGAVLRRLKEGLVTPAPMSARAGVPRRCGRLRPPRASPGPRCARGSSRPVPACSS